MVTICILIHFLYHDMYLGLPFHDIQDTWCIAASLQITEKYDKIQIVLTMCFPFALKAPGVLFSCMNGINVSQEGC